MPITPLFAALFGLMYVVLSVRVVKIRFAERISLGSADHKELERAVRTHGNFIEYVPLSLLLFWFLESVTFNSELVFYLASVLLVSRIAHVLGMNNPKKWLILRQFGVIGTFATLLVSSLFLLWWYLPISI